MKKVLTVDIGNSNIVIGVWNNGEIEFTGRMTTRRDYEYDELKKGFYNILYECDSMRKEPFEGSILSSVVPEITDVTLQIMESVSASKPLLMDLSLKTGIDTSEYDTSCLGMDRIVDLAAAASICGTPVMVCDLGTCTTISVVDNQSKLIGGMICAGIQLSLDAQAKRASQLPQLDAEYSDKILGQDTASNMISGAVSGTGMLISGVADRVSREYNLDNLKVVVTGGLGKLVVPWIEREVIYAPNLLLKGLYTIYQQNK